MSTEKIGLETLIPMDLFVDSFPIRIRVAYATPKNLLFGEQIYREHARLWLHKDLAKIVLLASKICHTERRLHFVLYDGLRTTNAQERMLKTQRVKENPQWLEEPRLLSPPGAGAHPRAMAIDVSLEKVDGQVVDMGTDFDYLSADARPEYNPAHRRHPHHSKTTQLHRKYLDSAMSEAADILGLPLLPLPEEWWDYRLPPQIYEAYEPLADEDLPLQMRMTDDAVADGPEDFSDSHFQEIKSAIYEEIEDSIPSQ